MKKSGSALKKLQKKQAIENPFENRKVPHSKFTILNRRVRGASGQPSLSKEKSINKRKATLLKEYSSREKTGNFHDKRIGAYASAEDEEDKMLMRFVTEKKRQSSKRKGASLFNLNDDAEDGEQNHQLGLTHKGKIITDETEFTSDEELPSDAEEEGHQLSRAHVSLSHFGGFNPAEEKQQGLKKSKSDVMKEIIAKSKYYKAERKRVLEENEELVDEIDNDFNEIKGFLNSEEKDRNVNAFSRKSTNEIYDEMYDVATRELNNERKAKPTDRLKTPEEIAAETFEKLQKLEDERIKRMNGCEEDMESSSDEKENEKKKRRKKKSSADALDDDFNGKINSDSSDESGEEQNGEIAYDLHGNMILKNDHESSTEAEDDDKNEETQTSEDNELYSNNSENDSGHSEAEESDQLENAPIRAGIESKDEIPYLIAVPKSLSELLDLISKYGFQLNLKLIIERIMACNHPSLAEGNKQKLQKFTLLLLDLFVFLGSNQIKSQCISTDLITMLNVLQHHFVEAVQTDSPRSGPFAQRILEHLHQTSSNCISSNPPLSLILLLQLCHNLYSTSDSYHSIATSAFLILASFLEKIYLSRDFQRYHIGLYLSRLAFAYIKEASRIVPEALNFLIVSLVTTSSLDVKVKKELNTFADVRDLKTDSLFVSIEKLASLEYLFEFYHNEKNVASVESYFEWSKSLAQSFVELYQTNSAKHPALFELLSPISSVLAQTSSSTVQTSMKCEPKVPLKFPKHKPVSLPSLVPDFVKSYSVDSKRGTSSKIPEKVKIMREFKREKKGAIRELKKDTRYLAQVKLDKVKKSDAEYKKKMSSIMGSIGNEGSLKKKK